jgi:hypothetical protein
MIPPAEPGGAKISVGETEITQEGIPGARDMQPRRARIWDHRPGDGGGTATSGESGSG